MNGNRPTSLYALQFAQTVQSAHLISFPIILRTLTSDFTAVHFCKPTCVTVYSPRFKTSRPTSRYSKIR